MKSFFISWAWVWMLWFLAVGMWVVGLIYKLNFHYWWFDVANHFLGGLWALVFLVVLQRHFALEVVGAYSRLALFVVLVSTVSLIGILWEFGEFVVDRYILHTGFTYLGGVFEDTLFDLLMDILGATFGFLLYSYKRLYA